MVEKIDRPEPAPAYQVVATQSAKDQRGQQQQQQPHQEDEFSSPGTPAEWRKIHGKTQERRLLRIRRTEIRRIGFRRAMLHSRAGILETDIELTNGDLLQQAQFLIPHLDEFMQWKGYAPGQDLPLPSLLHEEVVEVSVPSGTGENVGATDVTKHEARGTKHEAVQQPWWELFDTNTGAIRSKVLMLYVGAALAITVLVALL